MADEDDPTRTLSLRLAAAFGQVGAECIPVIAKYLSEAEVPREVSFGARVRFWIDTDSNLRAQLVPTAPKLPTAELGNTDFVLGWKDGQLAFDFVGVPAPVAPDIKEPPPPDPAPEPVTAAAPPIPKGANGREPVEAERFPGEPEVCAAVLTMGRHDWAATEAPEIWKCRNPECGLEGTMREPEVAP